MKPKLNIFISISVICCFTLSSFGKKQKYSKSVGKRIPANTVTFDTDAEVLRIMNSKVIADAEKLTNTSFVNVLFNPLTENPKLENEVEFESAKDKTISQNYTNWTDKRQKVLDQLSSFCKQEKPIYAEVENLFYQYVVSVYLADYFIFDGLALGDYTDFSSSVETGKCRNALSQQILHSKEKNAVYKKMNSALTKRKKSQNRSGKDPGD